MANKYAQYSLNKNPYKEARKRRKGQRSLYNSCIKKKKYRSERVAEEVIRDALNDRGASLRWYDCELCGSIHLTKKGL